MKWFLRRAALLTATVALAVTAVGTAGAQVTKPMTVAVLKFSNSSGQRGELLAKSASAATETQFIGSTRYDVVKKDTVDKTMTDLSLSYPLDRTGIQQLATALDAEGIVTGDVLGAARIAKTGQWRVTLKVEMTDRSSGELVNGAIVTGESGTRPDFNGSEDVLVDEAVNKAAFAAVRSMNERILPEGTVYATSSREGQIEALLNIGSNSGVRQGMEFIVLRNQEQVGRIRITSVSPTDASAAVVSTTRGVQPEDRIRAVFRLENIAVESGGIGGSNATIHRQKMSLGGLAVGAGLLFGLSKLAHGKFSEGLSARKATAVSSGPYNGAPVTDSIPQVPVIHISWRPPSGVNQQDILGYALYREDQMTRSGSPIYVAGPAVTEYYDTGRAIQVDANTNLSSVAGYNDGLVAGEPTRYTLVAAYNKTTTTTSTSTSTTGTTTTTVTLAPEVITSSATPILPPPTSSATLPTDSASLSSVAFKFEAVPGANRYIIQIADNISFSNSETYPKGSDGIVETDPGNSDMPIYWWGKSATDSTTNITTCSWDGKSTDCVSTFGDPRTDTTLQPLYCPIETVSLNLLTSRFDFSVGTYYWRVGAKNSGDQNAPENGGWVFGTPAPLVRSTATSLKAVGRRPTSGPVRPRGNLTPSTPDPTGTSGSVSRSGRGL